VAGEYFASGLVSAGVDCAVAEERGCGRVARKGLIRSAVSLALAAHTEDIKTGAFFGGAARCWCASRCGLRAVRGDGVCHWAGAATYRPVQGA